MIEQGVRHFVVGTHRYASTAHDAGLLGRDLFARGAQPVLMIEADGGDQRAIGSDDVDRIEAAAQTHLQNHDIELRLRKDQQRGERGEFEIGERDAQSRRFDTCEGRTDLRVIDCHAVDAHAFVVAQQMRRGIGTDTVARAAPDARE